MIAVDTNVLVHAHRSGSPKHAAARRRVVALAEGTRRWGIRAARLKLKPPPGKGAAETTSPG